MVKGEFLETFWRQQLTTLFAPTPLVIAKPVGSLAGHQVSYQEKMFYLATDSVDDLLEFCQIHQLDPFVLLLAAWAMVLSRYNAAQEEVVFGVNPSRQGLSCLVPFCVQVLSSQETLPWLKTLQAQYQQLDEVAMPLQKIRQWSRVPPELPLFESVVSLGGGTTEYPLHLAVENKSVWKLVLRYDKHRLESAVIDRLIDHFQTLLHGLLADPFQPLSTIALLPPAEHKKILYTWNQTTADYPQETCIHHLFEQQVARVPTNKAVIYADQSLTYQQLEERSNLLAHYLQKCGVGPDVLVGIYMERSLEMIVSMIGILKAGGAYVPLDPDYPPERLIFLLTDTRPPVLLTQSHLTIHLPPMSNMRTIALDKDWSLIASRVQGRTDRPKSQVTAQNVACVIYTSGSTGLPRGVLLEHNPTINLIQSFADTYHPTPEDQLVPLTSISFASFVGEMLPILCSGGTLILPTRTELLDFAATSALLTRHHTTMISTVPTLVTTINARKDHLPHLRLLLSGGEMLTSSDVDHLLQSVKIANGYGLTETTVCSTYYAFTKEDFQGNGRIPVGRPIMNTTAYVLDENLNPLPIGCSGELYIGGVGVARGYLGYPGYTAERFIPDPFSSQPGARLFKTGDRASFREDGNIDFFGRLDYQVKVRGFRIEPGEIEVTLREHPKVQEAVVVVHEDNTRRKELNDKRLVAYLVAKPYVSVSLGEIRNYLLDLLPNYMVPAAFVQLSALPRTPNGKINRRALPEPDDFRLTPETEFVPPTDRLQEVITEHWQKLFRLEGIGVYDDFFDLGGNSLLGTQMVSRLRAVFPVNLLLPHLFDSPTVKDFAERVELLMLDKLEAMSEETAQALLLNGSS